MKQDVMKVLVKSKLFYVFFCKRTALIQNDQFLQFPVTTKRIFWCKSTATKNDNLDPVMANLRPAGQCPFVFLRGLFRFSNCVDN